MKKSVLFHSELSHVIADMGHNQELTIGDSGLPVPPGVEKIDLAVSRGIPGGDDMSQPSRKPIVSMKGITKEFSGVRILDQVDFNIYRGRVMAFLGENGAGKSTLMKILTGVYAKTQGQVFLDGQEVSFQNTGESQTAGISIIHQELNLIRHLSIAENIFLGREPVNQARKINWKKLYADSQLLLDQLGMKESPKTQVAELSVGKQQMVEIAKALSFHSKVIIMDEPTGALTMTETETLFRVIRELRKEGASVVYISHRLPEIFQICDDLTVLRDGKLIGERDITQVDEDTIIEMMVGRKLSEQYPRVVCPLGEEMLKAEGLSNRFVKDISFSVRKGEILGVAGLMGSGRTELARTLYGIYKADQGTIRLDGKTVRINDPKQALDLGVAYVSEDRKENGIVLGLSVLENTTLSSLQAFESRLGRLSRKKEKKAAGGYVEEMSIKISGMDQLVRFLSGGNQQKVSLAKNLLTNPKLLILDEPTRGVDVGAKKEIYGLINRFKQAGMSILMISSEIPEILGMSDRIMVMHEGRLTGMLSIEEASQEKIMSMAVGKGVK